MLSIDEVIEDFKTMANDARGEIIHGDDLEPQEKYYNSQIELCAKEKEQIATWLEELKALRLLLDWAIECDFGLDSFPGAYEKYKHTLTDDMTYKDMIIQIAKCVVAEEIKEWRRNEFIRALHKRDTQRTGHIW